MTNTRRANGATRSAKYSSSSKNPVLGGRSKDATVVLRLSSEDLRKLRADNLQKAREAPREDAVPFHTKCDVPVCLNSEFRGFVERKKGDTRPCLKALLPYAKARNLRVSERGRAFFHGSFHELARIMFEEMDKKRVEHEHGGLLQDDVQYGILYSSFLSALAPSFSQSLKTKLIKDNEARRNALKLKSEHRADARKLDGPVVYKTKHSAAVLVDDDIAAHYYGEAVLQIRRSLSKELEKTMDKKSPDFESALDKLVVSAQRELDEKAEIDGKPVTDMNLLSVLQYMGHGKNSKFLQPKKEASVSK